MLAKVCCLTTDFCKGECLGLTRNKNVKLSYIGLFIITFVISLIMKSTHADPSQ